MSDLSDRIARWHRAVAGCSGEMSLCLETRKITRDRAVQWAGALTAAAHDMVAWAGALGAEKPDVEERATEVKKPQRAKRATEIKRPKLSKRVISRKKT